MNIFIKITILILSYGYVCSADYWIKDNSGSMIGGASLVVIYGNGTYEKYTARKSGFIKVNYKNKSIVTLLCAGNGINGKIYSSISTDDGMDIVIDKAENGGSIIITEGTGNIDGISGIFNPILDSSNRTYVYGRELSINDGLIQPVTFKLSESFKATDKYQNTVIVNIPFIRNRISILNYKFK